MKLLPILLAMDLLILAAVFNVIAAQGRAGSLGRNAVFGIRTRATMMNDGAWLAGHRAAAGALGTLVRWCLVASGVTLALFFVGLAVEWVSGGGGRRGARCDSFAVARVDSGGAECESGRAGVRDETSVSTNCRSRSRKYLGERYLELTLTEVQASWR
ncbi:SdpI family protein [Haematomicrobium sanguinis]|uniref:SdpI family protein n=1 Tax=Haematomicrobium sanguinis TaxID=479106 RepID=UPI0012FB74BF|nr:SdpI family protein [Haematomicrobium sanguinis]